MSDHRIVYRPDECAVEGERMSEPQHFLVVYDEGLDELSWDIEHPDSCPQRRVGTTSDYYVTWDCPYHWEAEQAGRDPFEPWPTHPGRYPIEHWVEKRSYPWVGEEVTTGVAVGEPS